MLDAIMPTKSAQATGTRSVIGRPALLGQALARVLSVPLLGKLAGANLIIVIAALIGVGIERRLHTPASEVSILGVALGLSLVVNLALVYVALRPLNDLETAAARGSAGGMEARGAPGIPAHPDRGGIRPPPHTRLH